MSEVSPPPPPPCCRVHTRSVSPYMKAVRAAPFLCHARMHPLDPLQLGARLERIETRGHVFHPSGQSRAVQLA